MDRESILREFANTPPAFDFMVIGGGATGLGVAWDAATRGFRTLLIERADFAQATSSRSTKLIHGGVRYLKQLNMSLVRESLTEREYLLHHAPELVKWRKFVIPLYHQWERFYYAAGLKLYDALAGHLSNHGSEWLSKTETLAELPGLNPEKLAGGISYWDGQFDDAALAIALAREIHEADGVALNYVRFDSFIKDGDRTAGAIISDCETNRTYEIKAKVVINATGVFSDAIRKLDRPQSSRLIAASRGSHIVLPATRIGGSSAMMLPKTRDGRVMFAIPWLGRTLVGTTDIPTDTMALEPTPSAEEIEFLLSHANEYLHTQSSESNILSCFAGLRPLVQKTTSKSTATLPRDHHVEVSPSGLITIVGGKWTTFRKMAEDTVDTAIKSARMNPRPCRTQTLEIPAAWKDTSAALETTNVKVDPNRIDHALNFEFARTITDVLSRRTRSLLLDARAAVEVAPAVGARIAAKRNLIDAQTTEQVDEFVQLARQHLPSGIAVKQL